jgi:hypothetical protein
MYQGPQLLIAPEYDMPAPAAISAIRSSHRGELVAVKMNGSRPSLAGATANFYVINKTIVHF